MRLKRFSIAVWVGSSLSAIVTHSSLRQAGSRMQLNYSRNTHEQCHQFCSRVKRQRHADQFFIRPLENMSRRNGKKKKSARDSWWRKLSAHLIYLMFASSFVDSQSNNACLFWKSINRFAVVIVEVLVAEKNRKEKIRHNNERKMRIIMMMMMMWWWWKIERERRR